MRKRKEVVIPDTKFDRIPEVTVDGFTILKDETIKIKGVYGTRFKFAYLVTNKETGSSWIDCYELFRGSVGGCRSFQVEKIKRIPKKRVKKSVSRTTTN